MERKRHFHVHELNVFRSLFFFFFLCQITCTKSEKATEFTLGGEGAGDEGPEIEKVTMGEMFV